MLLAATAPQHSASNSVLILAAVVGIAVVVLLITWLKVHPFLALIIGSGALGAVARFGAQHTIDSFTAGVGTTVGGVGLLIALGAMIGGLLTESRAVDGVIEATVRAVPERMLPWAFAGVAALIGIPLFFEVGVVLLVPIVLLVATCTRLPLMAVGIPALAGLSVLHGFVPPHPGPLAAIGVLKADLGLTLLFGLLLAIPAVLIAGPVFGTFIARYVPGEARGTLLDALGVGGRPAAGGSRSAVARADGSVAAGSGGGATAVRDDARPDEGPGDGDVRRPSVAVTIATALTPVVLMLLRAIGKLTLDEGSQVRAVLDVIGNPIVALLAGTVLAMFTLGAASGMDRGRISATVGGSLGPIAGILLIVAAGGGFKQTLVDAGVGDVIADWARDASISALVLGWLVAVGIRLATGSATVATITAAGIVAPLAADLDKPHLALLVLAVGARSLFFSHVNDAGFWLVKEYFGLTVGETIKTWSVMETLISVIGLLGVLVLGAVV